MCVGLDPIVGVTNPFIGVGTPPTGVKDPADLGVTWAVLIWVFFLEFEVFVVKWEEYILLATVQEA